jgi:hypothetical protein
MFDKKYILIACMIVQTVNALQYTTFLKDRPISIKEQYFTFADKDTSDYYTWLSLGTVIEQSVGKNIAPYFSLNNTTSLQFDTCGRGDINPLWLQLSDQHLQYQSTLDWNLTSQKIGALFLGKIDLESFFIECNTAFIHVTNKMNLIEDTDSVGLVKTVLSNQLIQNAYDAFAHTDWEYGKLYGASTTHGLDNIHVKCGTSFHKEHDTFDTVVTPYISTVFPTSSKSIPEYIFQAQAGTNTFSLGTGVACTVDTDYDLHFVIEGVYRYEFPSLQKRSFDLQDNGPWSRYLMVASANPLYQNLEFQGVSYYTLDAQVTNGHQVSANFHVEKIWNNLHLSAQYNIFARAKESISWVQSVDSNYGIVDINRADGNATSESRAHINQSTRYLGAGDAPVAIYGCHVNQMPLPDETFTTITNTDLNWNSACSPTMLTSIFAIGLHYDFKPVSVQVHVAYEHPHLGSIQKIDAWFTFQWDF